MNSQLAKPTCPLLSFVVILFICGLHRNSDAVPTVLTLRETLFVSEAKDKARDRDDDWLKDDLEFVVADYYKPMFVFDSDEKARRTKASGFPIDEPAVLFQVRPVGCIGAGCKSEYEVKIVYLYLFQRDEGWGESSDCPGGDHNGDNASVIIVIKSEDGKDWFIDLVSNAGKVWPRDFKIVQWQDSHVKVFLSSQKHHTYYDTSNDEDGSTASWFGCNDDVNGKGPKVLPFLISPYPDHRYSNVGEPENHDQNYFIGSLDPFGYKSEHALGGKKFRGGLGDDGADEPQPNKVFWRHDDFDPSGILNWDFHETHGGLSGKITDPSGNPIHGLTLYYRPVIVGGVLSGKKGPWSVLNTDANGSYQARVPLGAYLLRPAASNYDFEGVPKAVETLKGQYVNVNFVGKKIIPQMKAQVPDSASILSPKRQPVRTKKTEAPLDKAEIIKGFAFHISLPPQMVAVNPKSSHPDLEKSDPLIGLPRVWTVGLHVEAVNDLNGKYADSLETAACGGHLILPCQLGGPVWRAKIQVRLVQGAGFVLTADEKWYDLITDLNGDAFIRLEVGKHPGWTKLEARIIHNPANFWATFSETKVIEIQPAFHVDDSIAGAPANLRMLRIDSAQLPNKWWFMKTEGDVEDISQKASRLPGDANRDGKVDDLDLQLVLKSMGRSRKRRGFEAAADINNDGVVDQADEALVLRLRRQSPRIRQ